VCLDLLLHKYDMCAVATAPSLVLCGLLARTVWFACVGMQARAWATLMFNLFVMTALVMLGCGVLRESDWWPTTLLGNGTGTIWISMQKVGDLDITPCESGAPQPRVYTLAHRCITSHEST
jgi:hypothetical protein